ncbi:terminase small subunit [Psychrobacter immobilis]|uniref:terminase small subunit n=1 Tax=Psychrobacter immobilis TaxID=498 RepID=UPI003FD2EA51
MSKAKTLTPKQQRYDRFVSEMLVDGNVTRSAKAAGYSEKTAYSQGHRLLKNVEIANAIKAGQKDIAKRNELTIDDIIKELEEARTAALTAESPQSSAAVAATMGKAKVLGMLVDKSEVKNEGNISIDISFK